MPVCIDKLLAVSFPSKLLIWRACVNVISTGCILLLCASGSFAQAFLQVPAPFPGLSYCAVAWGDYDSDGRWDCLLVGSTNNNPVIGGVTKLFRNLGNGNFQEITTSIVGVTRGDVAWGDFDNDGDLDLLIGGSSENGDICRVYRNDSGGNFTDLNLGLPVSFNMKVGWADYDLDGKLDILISGDRLTRLYHNDGGGTFSSASFVPPGLGQGMQAWIDYDNDGDPDMLLTGLYSGSDTAARLYRNDGVSSFVLVNSNVQIEQGGQVQVVDFNGDSAWDFSMVGSCCGGAPDMEVYRNDGGI